MKKPLIANLCGFFLVMFATAVVFLGQGVAAANDAAEAAAVAGSTDWTKAIGYLAAALAVGISGIASGIAVSNSACAAIGALTENEGSFGKSIVFVGMAEGIAIYGLLIAFLTLTNIGVLGGSADISFAKGLLYLAACMPMAVIGLISAKQQAKAAVSSIALVAKRPDQFGKAMIFPAMVETYAVLALLVSLLAVANIGGIAI